MFNVKIVDDINHNLIQIVDNLRPNKIVIISSKTVIENCYSELKQFTRLFTSRIKVFVITDTEEHKTLHTCELLYEKLQNFGVDKNSLIINFGGGIITDIGAFVAATFKRGIRFVNVPTTLLGMVDASIGGKCGVNHIAKNQIGLFTNPHVVLVYPTFTKTQKQEDLLSGFAEIYKLGVILFDYDIISIMHSPNFEDYLCYLIEKAISSKLRICYKDPEDTKLRHTLNFGHTFGHAFETYLQNHNMPKPHGYCVAWGMIAELYLRRILTHNDLKIDHIGWLKDKFGPAPCTFDINEVLSIMRYDKKNESEDRIQFVIPFPNLVIENIRIDLVRQALEEFNLRNAN